MCTSVFLLTTSNRFQRHPPASNDIQQLPMTSNSFQGHPRASNVIHQLPCHIGNGVSPLPGPTLSIWDLGTRSETLSIRLVVELVICISFTQANANELGSELGRCGAREGTVLSFYMPPNTTYSATTHSRMHFSQHMHSLHHAPTCCYSLIVSIHGGIYATYSMPCISCTSCGNILSRLPTSNHRTKRHP